MVSDPRDPDPPAAELDEEEYVEPFEQERVDGEEVGGHDMRCLGFQKRPPRGTGSSRSRSEVMVPQDSGNRASGQSDPELHQFTLDAAVAPPGVLTGQTYHECGGLLVHPRASRRPMRVRPTPSDESTVPGEESPRCHSKATPERAGKEAAQGSQERTVSRLERRAPHLASEHGHLMAKGEQLDLFDVVSPSHQNHQFERTAHGEVYESPELTSGPSTSHHREGSRNSS